MEKDKLELPIQDTFITCTAISQKIRNNFLTYFQFVDLLIIGYINVN
jgi:hypothetical protein